MLMITSFYLALTMVLWVVLGARVAAFRNSAKIGLGTQENRELEKRVRVHGNLAEHAPMVLLGLAALEIMNAAPVILHAAGGVWILARLLHAFGLSRSSGYSLGRFLGTLLTWTLMLVMAIMLLIRVWPMGG
jgi:hypothetical protein